MDRKIDIFQYNAFTDIPFAGNPAGVVTEAEGLPDDTMQAIARQLNLAETAFLVPPDDPGADIRLRWFTPAMEVTLCGHATIAAFAAAAEHGLFPVEESGERELKVETLSGLLRVRISRQDGRPQIAMQIPVPTFAPLELDGDAFARAWGIGLDALAGEWLSHTRLDYWYIPVRDRAALRALRLDREKLSAVHDRAAFAFFTRDTVDPDSDWHLRFFAPFHGVDEDIVTGSAQGPMGVIHLGLAQPAAGEGWTELKGEQGDLLGRPGRVAVRVYQKNGVVSDLEIAGGAVPMLEGVIRI
ncbi:MAG: PhzF family phenazine biosynthesis protein [Gemmatimonadetes bacterium]|uniref:PhzF family phenazine biosynthesis protein n=1 Tax=Candidatus Kutchimonas denitrificans TaxID=3056748 RepID=A0AAE4ZBU5_9BACT|nr:PhzF family phenazine biosynthesis protein [Gemmatimonadota bacterium]NIR76492.1 PhzF family phenazine biosynthesis protein [Candidatus Kutchimonas denitrificans]NIS03310.1 PhzF family phenazine biosynthesis protein [Gemmatimonadota bacterium]NIT69171.1 PhzF family phenazine biosynthesis protein [Gemmatimonadota bacterium]NIU54563.1 PhzF family phenazine biosynthesis isomerase [Gemmatimonadota bacterium]